ncbi:PREDICTED: parathyroid hormone 2 receptor isoform X3 [Miniopterus natalensis]|uniref:parathyroid hormone 2 receptor isoform X3 n=1 Tax=Miniopterus natalensis TaxID=291302 RepID=UPI0007A706C7|nr:PREDICTED: parathyroid hormone 2 receptor isoform X3 [Miniopterus natalensis]
MHSLNKTWANYSDCLRFLQPDVSLGKQELFERLYVMYTVGYSISFGSLAVAVLIIGYFRCQGAAVPDDAGRPTESHRCTFCGQITIWFPAVFVAAWAVARATLADARCWELSAGGIKWIYQAPILAAIGLNFLLFLNTVRVLATKIWETNAVGHDTRKQYRKLAKSTLVLVLVFGVHYIVFVCLPHSFSGLGWEIRMHCELFFNSFQGFFVSIIYCYCNGEVQAEVKKLWSRWDLSVDWRRAPPCGGHRYGSVLTTVTHSSSCQSQLAAGGRPGLAGKATRTAGRQPDGRVTLPGYVWSSSEQDCQPHLILEETKEGSGRRGEEASLELASRPGAGTPDPEGSKGETEHVL